MYNSNFASTRRKTVRTAVLLVGSCFLLLVISLRVQMYWSVVSFAETLTHEKIQNVAWAAAQNINGDLHQDMMNELQTRDAITASDEHPTYATIHAYLREVYEVHQLHTPLYTYVMDQHGKVEFGVTSADKPYFRHAYKSAPMSQVDAYGERGTLPVYEDDHGTWLSGFAPIKDSRGKTVAMVQADVRFDTFIEAARQSALAGILWNILLLGALLTVVYIWVSRIMAREQADKEALADSVSVQTQLSTELTQRELELERKSAQLQRSNQDLTDFANIASHDLKSPLRGISSFAQLLARRSRSALDQQGHEYLDYILSNSKRALQLVDGLLAFAKADQSATKTEEFSLGAAISAARDNLLAVIEERKALVQTVGPLPTVRGDKMLITQLLQNLIANGIKYNQSETPQVSVESFVNQKGERTFAVRDNGIGIPEKFQAKVFDMFRRLHNEEQYEGSGIGLAFCVRVVNRYGGTIWLKSEEGQGSTFFFTLPLALQQPSAVVESPAQPIFD